MLIVSRKKLITKLTNFFKEMKKNKKIYYIKKLIITTIFLVVSLTIFFFLSYHNSYKDFERNAIIIAENTASEVDETILYTENLANFIANQIVNEEKLDNKKIAKILFNTMPRLDQKQNIYSKIFFDFINPEGTILVTGLDGVLTKNYQLNDEEKSLILSAKNNPWKIIPAKKRKGVITQEIIIPCGFGITRENGEFLGIITGGINVSKLQNKLSRFTDKNYTISLIDGDNEILFTSAVNLEKNQLLLKEKISTLNSTEKNGFIEVNKEKFYYQKAENSNFKVLIGINNQKFLYWR